MKDEKQKRKLKSRIFSVAAILAGVALLFAAYWVMQRMLERRQAHLLSLSGANYTAQEDESGTEDEERAKLTADELTDILVRRDFSGGNSPHDPIGKQMTMQEAIETGQAWIEDFCAKYGYPSDTVAFNGFSAVLYSDLYSKEGIEMEREAAEETDASAASAGDDRFFTIENGQALDDASAETETASESRSWDEEKTQSDSAEKKTAAWLSENAGNKLADTMYGYWSLTFTDQNLDIMLILNAVSGQVMSVNMEIQQADEYASQNLPLQQIVQDYYHSFDLDYSDSVVWSLGDNSAALDFDETIRFEITNDIYTEDDLGESESGTYVHDSFYMGVYLIR